MLAEHHTGGRLVRVFERKADASRLYFDGPALYTHVDAEGNNLLEYVDAMARLLRGAPDVLLLGTAGGALATQLSRRAVQVTAVDNWPAAFDIARLWFHLPPDVECVQADALTFLRSTPRRWSAVAIDVFKGVRIPAAFFRRDVGPALTRAAEPGGLIVWNVADHPESFQVRWIEHTLRAEGCAVSKVPVTAPDVGNTIVLGRTPAGLRHAA